MNVYNFNKHDKDVILGVLMFFFDRAFRSFFLGGSLFSVIAMTVWFVQFPINSTHFSSLAPMVWHAHEMVFGYALATVTGFLLTAAMNWTGVNSASGWKLMLIFGFWVTARLGYLFDLPLFWVALFDLTFNVGLFLHFARPIFQKKLWAQTGLASKFLLLIFVNALFYASALGWIAFSQLNAILLGLFLVLAINLTMMRRLLPFFTEKALGLPEQKQYKWLDAIALIGFFALMVVVVLWPMHWVVIAIALPLFSAHFIRLWRWYHPGIWKVTLLWPLFISYGFMTLGMLLFAGVPLGWVSLSIAIHALAAGGIGLLCSSIMARISLGHTNRNVFNPPKGLKWVFISLTVSAIFRVLLPMIAPNQTVLWIHISQLGWIVGFLWLSVLYWPILTRPSPHKETGVLL